NGGTFAAPAANREIGQSEALRLDAVKVGHLSIAEARCRLQHARRDEPIGRLPRDCERTRGAVICALASPAPLHPFEVRQHLRVAPPGKAEIPPAIVVAWISAAVHHSVDGGGAAEQLPAGLRDHPTVRRGLGLGLQAPPESWSVRGRKPRDRNGDERSTILTAACLEKQNAVRTVCGGSVRERASR